MANDTQPKQSSDYRKNSLSLTSAVSVGTGVMIGAGIFALTGQVAELAGKWFPFAFLAAAVVATFSSYSYIKMSNASPSAGGVAMIVQKAYGKTVVTGARTLLMYFSTSAGSPRSARFSTSLWTLPCIGACCAVPAKTSKPKRGCSLRLSLSVWLCWTHF